MSKNQLQKREEIKINPIERVKDPVICRDFVVPCENIYTPIIAMYNDPTYISNRRECVKNSGCNNTYALNNFLTQVFSNRVTHTFNCVLSGLQYLIDNYCKNTNFVFNLNKHNILEEMKKSPYIFIYEIESYITTNEKFHLSYVKNDATRIDVIFSILTLFSNNMHTCLNTRKDEEITEDYIKESTELKIVILTEIGDMLEKMFAELLAEVELSFSNAHINRSSSMTECEDNIEFIRPF